MTTINQQVLAVFLQEGAEQVEALNGLMLRLETAPADRDVIAQIMRTAHNLKGAAGMAGLGSIADVAHAIEEVILYLGDSLTPPSAALFDHLFAAMDALAAAIQIVADGKDEPHRLTELAQGLRTLVAGAAGRLEAQPGDSGFLRGFHLGEYDVVRMRAVRKQGKRVVRLVVAPGPEGRGTAWHRGLLKTLRQHGDVIATVPPETELADDDTLDDLTLLYASVQLGDELRALAGRCAATIQTLEEEEAPTTSAEPTSVRVRARGAVRVDLERVDGLVDMIGELVIAESMVANAPEIAALGSRRVQNYLAQLDRITRDLQDAGLRLRMVPLRTAFQSMARSVRDLARKQGKEINFVVAGESEEMDRSVVERLTDPLMHLVRNAVDHGVEVPDERERKGKPRTATVRLSAYHEGGSIVIELSDDGCGLDQQLILEKAQAMGLVRDAATLSDNEVFSLIFEPGLTTASVVTDISGRGVGLDVVRRNIESMRGRVTVVSAPNAGTTFRMILPLTLAIIDGMLITCGPERYIIPTLAIAESIRPTPAMVMTIGDRRQLLNMRGAMLPLVSLAQLFDIPGGCVDPAQGLVVVVETVGRRIGLVVDDVVAQQQVVIKSIGAALGEARFLSGAAILPDGRVGLILNIDEIAVKMAAATRFQNVAEAPGKGAPADGAST